MSNSFSFEIIDEENGYKYYLVPQGTILYRGDTTLYPNFHLPNSPAFFSTDARFVKHYGLVFRFQTKRPLKLLVLDKKADYSLFYNSSPPNIQRILKNNYGYISGLRETEFVKDHELVTYICSLGLDGYANNRMGITEDSIHDDYEGDDDNAAPQFHPEMALCNTNNVEFVNPQGDMNRYTAEQIEMAVLKKKADVLKREYDNKRMKNRRRPIDDDTSNEGSSNDESRPSERGLFGSTTRNDSIPIVSSPVGTQQRTRSIPIRNQSEIQPIPFGLNLDSPLSSPSRVSSLTSFPSSSSDSDSGNHTPVGSPLRGNIFDSSMNTPTKRSRSNYGGKRKTKNKHQRKIKNTRKQKKKGGGILDSLVTIKNIRFRKELEDRLRKKCKDGDWLDKKRKAYGFVGGSTKRRNKKTIRTYRKGNKRKHTNKNK